MKSMHSCEERLRYYGAKCEQHLNRMRLSHVLALSAVNADVSLLGPSAEHLLDDAFYVTRG